ncbi:MAG: DNA internalization-related competence protein ComEC/Rec2 [Acidobacteria bacterium]|nr:DNA internalization-related competence protein ComEC/Rec2 [Acidobacteriota bacterium]
MTDGSQKARALRPLWSLATGAALGAAVSALTSVEPPSWLAPSILVVGAIMGTVALGWRHRARHWLFLLAGFALVGGRGLAQAGDMLQLAHLIDGGETTIRATVVITEGWSDARWGRRTRARAVAASHGEDTIALPNRCRLEVRGTVDPMNLPPPGSEIEVLARVRGHSASPLLVVSSHHLIQLTGRRSPLPALRNALARRLLVAAGTDPSRIRAAEMAAALALGRRDLVPTTVRDRWRRSGLAHVLAVSGLHVGLVGGAVWLILALAGASPRATRLTVLAIVPIYAVLAGAAPSAMRAALMVVIYLGARLLGRAIIPMAAVLLAFSALLLSQPSLIANVGFQLTVFITAALVRWVPAVSTILPGRRWLAGAIAVPIVAQTAAAPIVAWHFRTLIPGAVLSNLVALPMLAPTILGSVAATAIAQVWSGAAGVTLDLVGALLVLLDTAGRVARAHEIVTPPMHAAAVVALTIAGWIALQANRWARLGVVAWISVLAMLGAVWHFRQAPPVPAAELLPVTDGAAVVVGSGKDVIVADTGRYVRESAELLAEGARRHIGAVLASHTDEDHLGGLGQLLRSFEVGELVLPAWMLSEPQTVPLLRIARRRGVQVRPVAAGSAVAFGSLRIVVLWPPAQNPPRHENERSLVARVAVDRRSVLLTADIGSSTERHLARAGDLRSEVLVVAHHGGRGSTSKAFLDAVKPSIALIPAAPGNTYGHPTAEVLERLAGAGIPSRYPARDGWCGAKLVNGEWVPFP